MTDYLIVGGTAIPVSASMYGVPLMFDIIPDFL